MESTTTVSSILLYSGIRSLSNLEAFCDSGLLVNESSVLNASESRLLVKKTQAPKNNNHSRIVIQGCLALVLASPFVERLILKVIS